MTFKRYFWSDQHPLPPPPAPDGEMLDKDVHYTSVKEANVVRSSAPITTGLPWMDLAPCRQDIADLCMEKLMEHCSQDITRLYGCSLCMESREAISSRQWEHCPSHLKVKNTKWVNELISTY